MPQPPADPYLLDPSATAAGPRTLALSVYVVWPGGGTGDLYAVVSTSPDAPTAAQVKAGLGGDGLAGAWSGSLAGVADGVQPLSATGLAPGTSYYAWFAFEQNGRLTDVVGASAVTDQAADPGGTFRRRGDLARVFRPHGEPARVFRRRGDPSRAFRAAGDPSRVFRRKGDPSRAFRANAPR